MSPSKPPTAKATMMERDEGSTLGGQRARRKFGGAGDVQCCEKGIDCGFCGGEEEGEEARGEGGSGGRGVGLAMEIEGLDDWTVLVEFVRVVIG